MKRLPLLLSLALLAACGAVGNGPGETPLAPEPVVQLRKQAGDAQTAAIGTAVDVDPLVAVSDARGQPVAGVPVAFVVTEDGWVSAEVDTTDAQGRASTRWYLGAVTGTQTLRAQMPGGAGVLFSAEATRLEPGRSYFGRNRYVELIPGELPLILSVPHDGALTPAEIPNRTRGTLVRDGQTLNVARAIDAAYRARGGRRPWLVLTHLHRTKLDANRPIEEGAQGNRWAEQAWREFHGFIEAARAQLAHEQGRGFYVDLHGHGHEQQRLELGYLLTGAELALPDSVLNSPALVEKSSIRTLVGRSGRTHAELLRGPLSLGALLEVQGFPSVPSVAQPHPAAAPYFTGGYNTLRHGSRDGGLVSGVQLELHARGVRSDSTARARFAEGFVAALDAFFAAHFGDALSAASAPIGLHDDGALHVPRADAAQPRRSARPVEVADRPHPGQRKAAQ